MLSRTDYRHQARTLALQALYELDCTDHPIGEVLEARLNTEGVAPAARALAERLVRGVLAYRETLDTLIQRYAPEWPLEQLAIIDRNILRMAIYEMGAGDGTPVNVAIHEAIELAKTFGAENTPRFINGVLGTLAAHESELQHSFASPPSRL